MLSQFKRFLTSLLLWLIDGTFSMMEMESPCTSQLRLKICSTGRKVEMTTNTSCPIIEATVSSQQTSAGNAGLDSNVEMRVDVSESHQNGGESAVLLCLEGGNKTCWWDVAFSYREKCHVLYKRACRAQFISCYVAILWLMIGYELECHHEYITLSRSMNSLVKNLSTMSNDKQVITDSLETPKRWRASHWQRQCEAN